MTRLFSSLMCCLLVALGTAAIGQQSDLLEVVVEGAGASPEAATKNALEQALMQAVGSFVDADTMLEQHSVIKGEVRSLASTIDTSMRKYSQGVIESFKLLGIENDNGIYSAIALVVVRSNELIPLFSGFESSFGGAGSTIDGSLFFQFQAEKEQEADRQSFIINAVLAPLYDWSAYDVKMRQPIPLREPVEKTVFAQIKDQIGMPQDTDDEYLMGRSGFSATLYEDRFGLMIPYSMRLKPEYVARVTSVLESTADRVGLSSQECEKNPGGLMITLLRSHYLKCYIFKNIGYDFWSRQEVNSVATQPTIAVQVLSKNGDIVNETVSNMTQGGMHATCGDYRYDCKRDPLIFHDIHLPRKQDFSQLRYKWEPYYLPDSRFTVILEELEGLLVLGITENLAQNAASIDFGPRLFSNEPDVSSNWPDALIKGVAQCLHNGALSSAALRVTVVISAEMTEDGEPIPSSLRLVKATGGEGQAVTQAYEAARRAILRCGISGYDLPQEKYDQWREIEMTFDLEAMFAPR